MGSAGLSMDFSLYLFFNLINRDRHFNRLGKDLFTMTFRRRGSSSVVSIKYNGVVHGGPGRAAQA
jgi:hypothetical protein